MAKTPRAGSITSSMPSLKSLVPKKDKRDPRGPLPKSRLTSDPLLAASPSAPPPWGPGSCLKCGSPEASNGAYFGPIKVAICDRCAQPLREVYEFLSPFISRMKR